MRKILIILTCLASSVAYAQVDNYAKNSKLLDDENARFDQDKRTNKDSATVYLKHANILASFNFRAYQTAWKFYEKALSFDSSKVEYYIDYCNYLYKKLGAWKYAEHYYTIALNKFPDNPILKNQRDSLAVDILKENEAMAMYDFGKLSELNLTKASEYSQVSNFDSLTELTLDKHSRFYYTELLKKFLADSNLSNKDIYMLLVGFTKQKDYNPDNYIKIDELHDLNYEGKVDEAIKNAEELLKKDPLNPTVYRNLMFSYRKKGNQVLAEKNKAKLLAVLNAMLYTGDGTCDKPYVVFWTREEYTLVSYLGYKSSGSVNMGICGKAMADKMDVTNLATGSISVISFNIKPIAIKEMGK